MTGAKNVLEIIVSEFPKHKKKITELYDLSSNFIEVCEDYVECLNSIQKLKLKESSSMKNEIRDLKLALSDLKEELLSRI